MCTQARGMFARSDTATSDALIIQMHQQTYKSELFSVGSETPPAARSQWKRDEPMSDLLIIELS